MNGLAILPAVALLAVAVIVLFGLAFRETSADSAPKFPSAVVTTTPAADETSPSSAPNPRTGAEEV